VEDLRLLVNAAQGGQPDAFYEIVRRFQGMAYACAYALLRDPHLARSPAGTPGRHTLSA
jgi:hypothetical protein